MNNSVEHEIKAEMRDVLSGTTPLVISQAHEPYMIDVPGYGVLIIGKVKSNDQWQAILVQPDQNNQFSEESNKVYRVVRITDIGLEVEILPNPAKEDRLVVCLKLPFDRSNE